MRIDKIPTFAENGHVYVVVETHKGDRNKYAYNPKFDIMEVRHTLPEGFSFPFDFGFIPGTKAEDGDPLDVLLFMDAPAMSGSLVGARLIGAITATQMEKGSTKKVRNDRLLAIADSCKMYADIRSVRELNDQVVKQIIRFFVSYNAERGKKFIPEKIVGPNKARKLVEQGMV